MLSLPRHIFILDTFLSKQALPWCDLLKVVWQKELSDMQGSKQLIVQDHKYAQRSCVYLNYKKMDEIGLNYGAVVLIKNERNGKEFAYVALPAESVPKRAIGIHSSLRNLLYLRLRDKVTIKAAPSTCYWKNINMQPTDGLFTIRYNVSRGVPWPAQLILLFRNYTENFVHAKQTGT